MTTLRRAKNGDWFARKRIPMDVRSAYERAHGKKQEERFRRSAAISQGAATQEFRDWDAELSSRIERLRAEIVLPMMRIVVLPITALRDGRLDALRLYHFRTSTRPPDGDL
jgi:hypothetical protein